MHNVSIDFEGVLVVIQRQIFWLVPLSVLLAPLLKKRDGGTYKQRADQTLNEYVLKKLINVDKLGIFDPFICA